MAVRILTLNIWNVSGSWPDRRDAIRDVINRADPDVVCLQEVIENERGNQAAWLAEALGGWSCTFDGEPVPAANRSRFGNAVLSRWPIESTASCRLPFVDDPAEIPRLAVHARTGGVDVVSTHLSWQLDDGALRERQVQVLSDFADEVTDPGSALGPVIAGDLNAEPDSTEVRFLTGLTSLGGRSTFYWDAWRTAGGGGPGLTWSDENPHAAAENEPSRRIDFVLSRLRGTTGMGRPLECRVVADSPVDGIWPSDHFGVLAVLAGP